MRRYQTISMMSWGWVWLILDSKNRHKRSMISCKNCKDLKKMLYKLLEAGRNFWSRICRHNMGRSIRNMGRFWEIWRFCKKGLKFYLILLYFLLLVLRSSVKAEKIGEFPYLTICLWQNTEKKVKKVARKVLTVLASRIAITVIMEPMLLPILIVVQHRRMVVRRQE